MILSTQDYDSQVGVIYLGGFGSNNASFITKQIKPNTYKNFSHFVANTDVAIQRRHFGNITDPNQVLWSAEHGRLVIHQLGGKEVTQGLGAGTDPRVGRQAAETTYSQQELTRFIEDKRVIIVLAALGGGTGTGGLYVVAKLAKEMGKVVVAIVVRPEPGDGREDRADRALKELQPLGITTFVIHNEYIDDFVESTFTDAAKASFSYADAWRVVDENSTIPMIRILREIVQETGDIINLDEANLKKMLSFGNRGFLGFTEIEKLENLKVVDGVLDLATAKSAREIADEMLAGHFQDPSLIRRGKVLGFWVHGPWLKSTVVQVQKQIKKRMCSRVEGKKEEDIEVIKGILHHVSDGERWMAMIIVASDEETDPAIESDIEGEILSSTSVSAEREQPRLQIAQRPTAPISVRERVPSQAKALPEGARSAGSSIRFKHEGTGKNLLVKPDLATRFNRAWGKTKSNLSLDEAEALRREVEEVTGILPDLPPQLCESQEEKKPGVRDILSSFIRRSPAGDLQ